MNSDGTQTNTPSDRRIKDSDIEKQIYFYTTQLTSVTAHKDERRIGQFKG